MQQHEVASTSLCYMVKMERVTHLQCCSLLAIYFAEHCNSGQIASWGSLLGKGPTSNLIPSVVLCGLWMLQHLMHGQSGTRLVSGL